MAPDPEMPIEDPWDDGTAIDQALREAVREALLRHKKLGNSIVIWRDGKVVWVPPEEIEVDETPGGSDGAPGDSPGSGIPRP